MNGRSWDAVTYDEQSNAQFEWGREVLERLELRGDERVLDAGCGSGRVTELIVDRLPRGRVIGVDSSPAMIAAARERLGERAELIVADLTELELAEPVDAVFSNAAFHWMREQDLLFRRLAAALRPGGRLEAQSGGIGNIAELEREIDAAAGDERFADSLRGVHRDWYFSRPGDADLRLERAGFVDRRLWLEEEVVTPRDPHRYLRAIALASHLDALPDHLQDEFVDAVLGSMPRPFEVRYVRLNISARRAETSGR